MGLRSILVKNGIIWDGGRFLDGNVLVENGVIKEIGSSIETLTDYTYDASGCIVSPGFVDIHTHVRGISSDQFGVPIDAVSFPFGVTAVADASAAKGNRALADLLMVKNVVFLDSGIFENRAVFAGTDQMLELYGDKAIGIKIYFDTEVSEVCDIQPLQEVCAYARAHKLKVMVHCTNSPVPIGEVLDCLAPGDICTHAYHGGVYTTAEDDFAALKEAKMRGVIIDAGMAGGVHTDFKVLKAAIKSDALPDVISTDITSYSAFIRGGRYGMTMCMSMMRHYGINEEKILRAVTSDAAKALGKEKEWGYLKVGRRADVSVVAYSDCGFHITDKAGNIMTDNKGYRCRLTIADGQVVYRE